MKSVVLVCVLLTLAGCKTRGNQQRSDVSSVDTLDGKYESVTFENDDEIDFLKKVFGKEPFNIPNEVKIGCGQNNCYLTIPRPKSGTEQKYKFGTTMISDGKAWYSTKNDTESEEYASKLFNSLIDFAPEQSKNFTLKISTLSLQAEFVETTISCSLAGVSPSCTISIDLKSNPRPN